MTACNPCYGSGQLMGVGMMLKDCHHCSGTGKKLVIEIDKRSKSYRDAIKKIKELNANITDAKADEIFKEEFDKIAS